MLMLTWNSSSSFKYNVDERKDTYLNGREMILPKIEILICFHPERLYLYNMFKKVF